ncbi:MAG: ABC transporter permease [Anaerolineales bacterium]
MRSFFRVMFYEYKRYVLQKRFLFALISVPLWIVATIGIGIFAAWMSIDDTPIGYVDEAGFLANPLYVQEQESWLNPKREFIAYPNQEAARAALDADDIPAFYIFPPDYISKGEVTLVAKDNPSSKARSDFRAFLRLNLIKEQSSAIAVRVIEGADIRIEALESSQMVDDGAAIATKIIVPIFVGLTLMFTLLTISGYLMQTVVEEKENRTMEILITSVSPEQMMIGKIFAVIGIGFTQIIAWIGFGCLGLVVALFLFVSSLTSNPQALIPPESANVPQVSAPPPVVDPAFFDLGLDKMLLPALMIFPAFLLMASLMAAIGATVTERSEAQSVAGWITMITMLPLIAIGAILNAPNSPFVTFLSFFPLTAAMGMTLRVGLTEVPQWQIWLSMALLTVCAVGGLWLAGRVLRFGMLRYGQRMHWGEIWQAIRKNGRQV